MHHVHHVAESKNNPFISAALLSGIIAAFSCLLPSFVDAEDINSSPLWNYFDQVFCRGKQYAECSFGDTVACNGGPSNVSITVDFKMKKIEFHGNYNAKEVIKHMTYQNHLNPSQTILLGDGRVIHMTHYKFGTELKIIGFLSGDNSVAYGNPDRIMPGAEFHTLTCFSD